MICPKCKKETISISIFYRNGERIEGCRDCISLTPTIDFRVWDDTGIGRIGVGHKRDIKSRKLDYHTQKVYRDKGTKYFVMNRT